MDNTERVRLLEQRLSGLQADRGNFNSTWERIARVILPSGAGFNTRLSPGQNLNYDIYDSTAQLALPKFASAIHTMVTPQNSKWHLLKPKNKKLRANRRVTDFCYELNDMLWTARYSPKANFVSRAGEVYMSLGAFGSGPLYIQDAKPGIRYISIHLGEIWFAENDAGLIDTAFWEHEYTNRQAVQKWPNAPAWLHEEAKAKPDAKRKYCKVVQPRVNRDTAQRDKLNMPFENIVFMRGNVASPGDNGKPVIMEEGGYRTFPFAVARYVTAPREIYSRGPAHDALADTLTLQEMSKTGLRYGQLVTDPPVLTADVDAMPFSVRPGSINPGFLSATGEPLAQAFRPEGDPRFSLEMMEQRRQAINGAFLVTLFQVLIDSGSDRMTATEVMQRVQEKGALLSPVGGRLRTEFLGPIIDRELDIFFHAGVVSMSDIPPELIEDGGGLEVEYDSPLTRAMQAEEGVGILRTLEFAGQIAQFDPAVVRKVNSGRALERMAEINGAPPDILFTDEEVAEQQQADREAAATAQMIEAAPAIADTAKTLVETQNLANQPRVI